MKKELIRKLAIRSLVFLLILITMDQSLGRILRYYYFKQTSGLSYRTTLSIDSTMAEILVFGSSRANHHYVPKVFEDCLHTSFYNTGRDGNSIMYSAAVFSAIIKRYTPKIVLLDITPGELNYNPNSYDRLSSLLPYCEQHSDIRQIVLLRSKYEKVKLLSSIYPFNSIVLSIGISNLDLNKQRKKDANGYVPLYNHMNETKLFAIDKPTTPIDSIKVKSLEMIAQRCRDHNIALVFVHSPIYSEVPDRITTQLLTKISKEYGATFYNYLEDPVFFGNSLYFSDQVHLNDTGAKLFSTKLATTLKSKSKSNIYNNSSISPPIH